MERKKGNDAVVSIETPHGSVRAWVAGMVIKMGDAEVGPYLSAPWVVVWHGKWSVRRGSGGSLLVIKQSGSGIARESFLRDELEALTMDARTPAQTARQRAAIVATLTWRPLFEVDQLLSDLDVPVGDLAEVNPAATYEHGDWFTGEVEDAHVMMLSVP